MEHTTIHNYIELPGFQPNKFHNLRFINKRKLSIPICAICHIGSVSSILNSKASCCFLHIPIARQIVLVKSFPCQSFPIVINGIFSCRFCVVIKVDFVYTGNNRIRTDPIYRCIQRSKCSFAISLTAVSINHTLCGSYRSLRRGNTRSRKVSRSITTRCKNGIILCYGCHKCIVMF